MSFKSSRASELSGVSQSTIRNWRRCGYLPTYDGLHQNWSDEEVFAVWVLGRLSKVGFSLKRMWPIAMQAFKHRHGGTVLAISPSENGFDAVFVNWRDADASEREVQVFVYLGDGPL